MALHVYFWEIEYGDLCFSGQLSTGTVYMETLMGSGLSVKVLGLF